MNAKTTEFSSQLFPPSPHKSTAFALHSGIDQGVHGD